MLTDMSEASCPPAASSDRRRHTMPGDGRNSGRTRPAAVAAHHNTKSAAKTIAAMVAYSRLDSRALRPNRRRGRGRDSPPPALLRGSIDEAWVDQPGEVHV